jgi:hypothetical protein
MAKTTTDAAAKPDKKKKKAAPAATVKIKVKGKKADAKKDKGAKKAKSKSDGFDGLSKLVDHPLVADLLAAGAMAAVAAIAEHQLGKSENRGSSKLVKTAGKAAAAAMGRKLMGDIGAITTAATDAAKKA